MDKLLRGIPDDLIESLQKFAAHHRRSLNAEILIALETYASDETTLVQYKSTTNVDEIWAMRNQIPDGKIIIKADVYGRRVHVVSIDQSIDGQKWMAASWHGWADGNHIIKLEDVTEFYLYTERQYAAMMDAVRKEQDA